MNSIMKKVPGTGLEPAQKNPLEPKPSASTNSAIPARESRLCASNSTMASLEFEKTFLFALNKTACLASHG